GVLTVTDGAHTANINLIGDFTFATFAARSDGHGGVIVTAAASAATAPPHRLIAAMASLGAPAGSATHSAEARALYPPIFARPHANVA
ncbi:MAG: hypothetical protein ABI306_04260, partial [Caulobacteraceae bacterium]